MNTPRPGNKPAGSRAASRLLALLAIAALVLSAGFLTPLGAAATSPTAIEKLMAFAASGDPEAALAFLALSSLLIMVGTPRLLFFTFGGFAFGFLSGLFYSLCACLAGSLLAFSLARWGARDWLDEKFGERRLVARIVRSRPSILSIAVLRFLPISNALVNVGLALSKVRVRELLIGSLIGYLPQGVAAALVGSGLAAEVPERDTWQFVVAALLLVLMLLAAARIRRKPARAG